jgi:hypothetical protein
MSDESMGVEHWKNNTDREILKLTEINLALCHSDHHKSHTDWSTVDPGHLW